MTAEALELPFDQVVLLLPTERSVTAAEFFALPLAIRLRHVIAKSARFLRDGELVDPQAALAQMRVVRLAS